MEHLAGPPCSSSSGYGCALLGKIELVQARYKTDSLSLVYAVLAMPRPRVLRRLWRQIAELGISRIVLTITDTVPPGYSTSEAVRPHVVMREVLQVCQRN